MSIPHERLVCDATVWLPASPPVGHLIAYEYLWHSQAHDRDDGVKTYPAAVVMVEQSGGEEVAYVLCISHSEPLPGRRTLEVPLKLKRHLGLDAEPAWIFTDEVNVFPWPGPDLRDADRLSSLPQARGTCVIGRLPGDWFDQVKDHLLESYRLGLAKAVPRGR